MTPTVWITHPGTGAVVEVPSSALPMYRQSGWDVLSDEELTALEQERVEDIRAAERAMQAEARRALAGLGVPAAAEDERTPEELAELGAAALAPAEDVVPDPDDQPEVVEEQPTTDAAGRRTKKGNA